GWLLSVVTLIVTVSRAHWSLPSLVINVIFFFNDTATTEIYTLSLHDALPIWRPWAPRAPDRTAEVDRGSRPAVQRSEEHTSELQSLAYLVCRLLLEKKKS